MRGQDPLPTPLYKLKRLKRLWGPLVRCPRGGCGAIFVKGGLGKSSPKSDFRLFQIYVKSLVFWPRPVASVRGVDLAWQQVVAEKIGTGNFSQPTCCCLLTTSGHCPGSLNVPPGTPTLRATLPSRSASVKLRYLGGPTPFSQFSHVQFSWFRGTSRASDFH